MLFCIHNIQAANNSIKLLNRVDDSDLLVTDPVRCVLNQMYRATLKNNKDTHVICYTTTISTSALTNNAARLFIAPPRVQRYPPLRRAKMHYCISSPRS